MVIGASMYEASGEEQKVTHIADLRTRSSVGARSLLALLLGGGLRTGRSRLRWSRRLWSCRLLSSVLSKGQQTGSRLDCAGICQAGNADTIRSLNALQQEVTLVEAFVISATIHLPKKVYPWCLILLQCLTCFRGGAGRVSCLLLGKHILADDDELAVLALVVGKADTEVDVRSLERLTFFSMRDCRAEGDQRQAPLGKVALREDALLVRRFCDNLQASPLRMCFFKLIQRRDDFA